MARKIATTVYITPEQQDALRELSTRTKVPVAEYIRQGIDAVIDRNRDRLPGQLDLSPLPLGSASDKAHDKKSSKN